MVKLRFGRDICNCLPVAEKREWLVTNGIGGFAAGTVAGLLTRCYHGLLNRCFGSTDAKNASCD